MNDYKYGDWFCRPADKDEALEIVKLAVASGAVLHDTVYLKGQTKGGYDWNLCGYWGVFNGRTYTTDIAEDIYLGDYSVYTLGTLKEVLLGEGEHESN